MANYLILDANNKAVNHIAFEESGLKFVEYDGPFFSRWTV